MGESLPARTEAIAAFYRENPRMVSSPFGGVDSIDDRFLEEVFRELDIDLTGRRVLDIGCGRGFISALVEKAGGTYTGIDLVPSGSGFRLSLGEACHLPFRSGTFDAVFCIDAFEHIPNPDLAAAEMRRVLGDEGCVFLSTPNYGNVAGLVKRYCEVVGSYDKNTWAPFGRWQAQEWETPLTFRRVRRIFRGAGFPSGRVLGHGGETGLGLFPWMDHPRAPEAIRFRLQRFFQVVGPPICRAWPGSSLHGFWKWEV